MKEVKIHGKQRSGKTTALMSILGNVVSALPTQTYLLITGEGLHSVELYVPQHMGTKLPDNVIVIGDNESDETLYKNVCSSMEFGSVFVDVEPEYQSPALREQLDKFRKDNSINYMYTVHGEEE